MAQGTRRQFSIHRRMSTGHGDAIIDIPHPVILRHRTAAELVNEFEEEWKVKPKGVVIPVVAPDGLLYRCDGLRVKMSEFSAPQDKFKGFSEMLSDFAALGCSLYLALDPSMSFVRSDALHITDIVGEGSSQLCIGNPHATELMGAVLGMGIDIAAEVAKYYRVQLEGVVIDAVDLWPMGAKNERVKPTCFCDSCVKSMEMQNPGLIGHFRTFPNPWNLVLKDSGTGISYISNLPPTISASEIVGLCRQRGFHEAFGTGIDDPKLNGLASVLIKYIEARHEHTMSSLDRIFTEAIRDVDAVLGYTPKRVVILEGTNYDWTSGIQLKRLDHSPKRGEIIPMDELWFDPVSSEMAMTRIPFRSYMWRRARYYIDAFFSLVANAADPGLRSTTAIAYLQEKEVREHLRDRLSMAIGSGYDSTSLLSLPELKSANSGSYRIGFVGVALTRAIGEELIRNLHIPPGKNPKPSGRVGTGMAMLEALLQQQLMQAKGGDDADT